MNLTLGIFRGVGSCPSLADRHGEGTAPGPEVIVSPPATPEDVSIRVGVIVLEGPEERLSENLSTLRTLVGDETVIVSTSPVVSLATLRSLLGPGPSLCRMIVSVGTLPGEGAVALAAEPGTGEKAVECAKKALSWIGPVETVPEDGLDAVAALALGGAAFLCEALRGLEDGAVGEGLQRDTARTFTAHTILATALLLHDHPGSPADLKDQVASPGGTTIAALAALEDAGVRGAYLRAIQRTAAEVRKRRDAARSIVVE